MLVVTILMIMAWWLIILFFAFIIQLIPLKNYHKNITKVQITLSSISIMLGLISYFYVKINYSSGIFDGSGWDEEWVALMMLFYFLCFILSLFRLYAEKKASRNKIETFLLKAEEYKIVKKFDFTMGDYIYSPNVKSYCEFDKGLMAFAGSMPNKEVDCYFTCREVKDGIYECISFEPLSDEGKKISLSKIKQLVFLVATAIYFALAVIALSKKYTCVSKLVEGLTYILLGSFCCNIFYGVKGLFSKFLFMFSILIVLVGIRCFFV